MTTRDDGYSLVEVLLALTITLIVMALVAQTMSHVRRVYEAQTQLADTSSSSSRALDDIAYELSLAGQGLGEGVPAVVPRIPGGDVDPSTLTLRSNPELAAAFFRSELQGMGKDVALDGADAFAEGGAALLVNARGGSELAEVTKVSEGTAAFRSLETVDGSFRSRFGPAVGARALAVREVRYFLRTAQGDGVLELVKDVVGVGERVLARDIVSMRFEYLDELGKPIAAARVQEDNALRTVRVMLEFLPGANATEQLTLSTAVTPARASGTVDFESRDVGFRLSRIFFPIENPVGVASRIGAPWGVIVSAGGNPQRDAAYAYTFMMEERFMGVSVDDVAFFEDVRAPVSIAFGPERGPLAGSLFVAARGLRIGHVSRMAPDAYGKPSSESEVTTFEGTEAIAQAGGLVFGVDDALYLTSREKGALYRYRFDAGGKPGRPEPLFALSGTPGTIVEGIDGHLYFLMERANQGFVWRMAFDETLTPTSPERVGALPGIGVSMTRDPVDGNLLALVQNTRGDYLIIELTRTWLYQSEDTEPPEPRVVFSLAEWREKLEEGRVAPREVQLAAQLGALRPEKLDFIAFDELGSLYAGAQEANLVLKFELPRPSGRYAVGIAAGVIDRGPVLAPEIRMHAWKKSALSP